MDCNIHTLSNIYKEIETKVNEQLSSILLLQNNPEDLLNKHNLEKLELDVCSKFGALVTQNKTDGTNAASSVKNLDSLFSSFVVDARETNWLHLNKKLQECVSSADEEIFKKGLQIHYKMITSPAVSPFGYLNLLETFSQFSTTLNPEQVQERTLIVLKLLLKTQSELLKNTNPSKSKTVEKVIAQFILTLSSHTDTLRSLAHLDVRACWFQKFTYSAPNRKVTLSYFKNTNLIDYFLLLATKQHHADEHLIHCVHLLKHYFSWDQTFSIFPLQTEEVLTLEHFVASLLKRLNCLVETPNDSLKQSLGNLLKSMFAKRPVLIVNSDVRKKLFEPLLMQNRSIYTTIGENEHVLDILNDISKNSNASKYLLDSKSTRGNRTHTLSIVEKHNAIEVIANLTIMCIRNFINESEREFFVDNKIFNLIDCCVNLLTTHVQVFNCVNLTKLIDILQDLYEIILNYNFNSNYYKVKVATALCILIQFDYSVLKVLANRVLKEVVESVLADVHKNTWCNLILTLSHIKEGRLLIESNYHIVIKQLLCNIWVAEVEEEQYEICSNAFLQVITVLNKFHVVRALLQYENEGTICDSQDKPVTLSELIENCLDVNYLGTVDVVLGLRCIRIWVTNLDVLLYLQHNYKLQENLVELQVRSNTKHCENSSTAMLIDECSWLRHYILLSIKYNSTIDAVLNEKLLNQTKVITAPYQSTFIPRTCNALQKFLHSYKNSLHDHNWVGQVRKSFRISCKGKYKASVVLDLIDQMPKSLSTNSSWPSSDVVLYGLFPEDYYGVTTIIQFGIHNNLLHSSMQNDENLILLLRQSRTFLGFRPEEFIGFDWLVAVVFLMSSGKIEKCKQPLMNISTLPIAPVIWPLLTYTSDKKQNLIEVFYRQLEIILEDNTKINSALKSVDVSAKHVAERWLNQCFFAILEFKELCNFVSLIVLYPSEYILYYLIALFEHCRDDIFDALQAINSVQVLKISQTSSFQIADHFNFMDKLNKRYKNCLRM